MLRKHQGGADKVPTPANDITALQNEQVMHVQKDNYRNSSIEAKHQQDLLKDNFNHVGYWLRRRTGSEMGATLGIEAGIYHSFSGLPNNSKNFYLSWCCSNFEQISKNLTSYLNYSHMVSQYLLTHSKALKAIIKEI